MRKISVLKWKKLKLWLSSEKQIHAAQTKSKWKGLLVCNKSLQSHQSCVYAMGDKILQDKNRMHCKLRGANYYFWKDNKNLLKVYSYCCKSYTIQAMWLYSSSAKKTKSSEARVNGQKQAAKNIFAHENGSQFWPRSKLN